MRPAGMNFLVRCERLFTDTSDCGSFPGVGSGVRRRRLTKKRLPMARTRSTEVPRATRLSFCTPYASAPPGANRVRGVSGRSKTCISFARHAYRIRGPLNSERGQSAHDCLV